MRKGVKMDSNRVDEFMDIVRDSNTRVELAKRSHFYFFHIYFSNYIKYRTAPFHREIFRVTEDESNKLAVVIAHRGAGKSTILTTSFPIWAILGKLEKRNVLIVCQTKLQASQHLANVKRELEENELLRSDLGPIQDDNTWNINTLVFKRTGARISAVSKEQKFRGARHKEVRPDLIIIDDLDDSSSIRTQESRDKTFDWYSSEIVPLGDPDTKFIITGNMLHEDSFIKRLEKNIEKHPGLGIYQEYPIVKNGEILWPGKYPSPEAVEMERTKVGNERIWQREYCLTVIYEGEPVIKREWIRDYDDFPPQLRGESYSYAIGVDLAGTPGERSDYTAIVMARVYRRNDITQIFILPNPIKKKLTSDETLDFLKSLESSYDPTKSKRYFIEGGGTQNATIDLMKKFSDLDIVNVGVNGMNKRDRMFIAGFKLEKDELRFAKTGNEELKNQIYYIAEEEGDDLADAFSTLVRGVIENPPSPRLYRVGPNTLSYDPPQQEASNRPRSHQKWSDFLDEETRREFDR